MSSPKPPGHRTTSRRAYNAALARRGSLLIWCDPETKWLAEPTGKRGRQPVFADAAVQIPDCPSAGALRLLIDSTGIKAEGDGEWFARRHGPSKPRRWRKVPLGTDGEPLEIRATESSLANARGPKEPVDGSRVGDAPMLPDLLDQVSADRAIGMVAADGAHDTRACHAAIAARGAAAVIPPRKNGRPWKDHTAGAKARNDTLRASRRLGRAI